MKKPRMTSRRLRRILISMATVAALSGCAGAGTVRFPTGRSMGRAVISDPNLGESWRGEARGKLKMQKGEVLALKISAEGATDLSPLRKLRPDDLRALDLSDTAIDDADLEAIEGLTGLDSLNLARTAITDAGLVHLRFMTRMKFLNLSGTKIGNEGLARLKALAPTLQTLNLYKTSITDAGLVHLEAMKNLTSLDMASTAIGDNGVAHLTGLTGLEFLYLQDSKVGDGTLKHLENFKRLQQVEMFRTAITKPAVQELRKVLPECRIKM